MITLTPPDGAPRTRRQAVAEAPAARVVARPVPESQARDPRGYQMDQLRRRFSPAETRAADGSASLVFRLCPSDPDFPFDLAHLDCDLRVPPAYPDERPELRVRNSDMPRGFAINIERAWQRLADETRGATLLALVNALDKNLERFLSEKPAETVKLVAFKGKRRPEAEPASEAAPRPYVAPEDSYTKEQVAAAKARRAREVHQLEARMGRLPRFRRSADDVVFTLPVEPKGRAELPPGLRSVSSVHLIVPLLYPLQDLRVQLNDAEAAEAEPVEELFASRAAEHKDMSLMSHVNYLVQNLCSLDKQAKAMATKAEAQAAPQAHEDGAQSGGRPLAHDKSHVKVIPRPPEWSVGNDSEDDDGSDDDSFEDGDGEEPDGGVGLGREEDGPRPPADDGPARGTMMSFPAVELHGIELLEVSVLSLSVRCVRCKTANDMTGLKGGAEKTRGCTKCASQLAARFRPQPVHAGSATAGFVDVSGAVVADLLPSTVVPTCGRCSAAAPGLVTVRGETVTNVCRECHGRFTLKLPEVRFLQMTAGAPGPAPVGRRRRPEQRLGLRAGEPLPGRGVCAHYRRSFRWFRFSCCGRVHACDRCHDGAEDHEHEWAKRMLCGWCSREQPFAEAACGFCGRSVVGPRGRGFWEGGKGTRDQRLMSRKDPRKYKRLGG